MALSITRFLANAAVNNDTVVVYSPPRAAQRLSGRPTFGQSRYVSEIGTNQQQDYLKGLVFAGMFFIIVFCLWFLLLTIFKCMGHHRVGFLSGSQFQVGEEHSRNKSSKNVALDPSATDDDDTPDNHRVAQPVPYYDSTAPSCLAPLVRILFLLFGVLFMVFTIVLFCKGIDDSQTTVDTLNGSAGDVERISGGVHELIVQNLTAAVQTASKTRTEINTQLKGNLCPNANALLSTVPGLDQWNNISSLVTQQLGSLQDFASQNLQMLADSSANVEAGARQVKTRTDGVHVRNWAAYLLLVIYLVVPLLLMISAVLALSGTLSRGYSRCVNCFLWPLFVLMILLAWIVAFAASMGASANSDFCLPPNGNSPDQSVYNILEKQGYNQSDYTYQVVEYYVQQCAGGEKDPLQTIRATLPQLNATSEQISQLQNILTPDVITVLGGVCNRDLGSVSSVLTSMKNITSELGSSMSQLLNLISCDNIVPVYIDAIYNGTCESSIQALYWFFSASLIVGIAGLLMLTFRSATKPDLVFTRPATFTSVEEGQETSKDTFAQTD